MGQKQKSNRYRVVTYLTAEDFNLFNKICDDMDFKESEFLRRLVKEGMVNYKKNK